MRGFGAACHQPYIIHHNNDNKADHLTVAELRDLWAAEEDPPTQTKDGDDPWWSRLMNPKKSEVMLLMSKWFRFKVESYNLK